MNLTKDMYEYLTGFAEDRDILNMLSVNKKFRDDAFFERILIRKYPLLINFKRGNESFKILYLRMVRYIEKLKEEFGIPYIPGPYFNPETFYKEYRDSQLIYQIAGNIAVEIGRQDIVDKMIEKGAGLDNLLFLAMISGNLQLVKHLVEKGAPVGAMDVLITERRGYDEIAKYLTLHKK
jgi:hypothetical protein